MPTNRRKRLRAPTGGKPRLEDLTDADLLAVSIAAPGEVATSDRPGVPWPATPSDGSRANELLTERGYWDAR
jgi:hypothetical protein